MERSIQEYINNKTNSILKYSIKRNNRDVVATIVYNELTNLLEFSNAFSITTPIDNEIIKRCINTVNANLYSDKPLKLTPYCNKCLDPCCCCDHINSLPDCFILGLELEDGAPLLQEQDDNGIILLEKQRETECSGKLVCDCWNYAKCSCNKYECIATLQLEPDVIGSFLWDCDTPILLEDQELCDCPCCISQCECFIGWENNTSINTEDNCDLLLEKCQLHKVYVGPIKWEDGTAIRLEKCLDLLLEGDYTNYYEDDEPCNCCCSNGSCSICKK